MKEDGSLGTFSKGYGSDLSYCGLLTSHYTLWNKSEIVSTSVTSKTDKKDQYGKERDIERRLQS